MNRLFPAAFAAFIVAATAARAAAPENDLLARALPLPSAVSGTQHGSTEGSTVDQGEPAHGSPASATSVWYTWTVPGGGTGSLHADAATFTCPEGLVEVYLRAPAGGLTPQATSFYDASVAAWRCTFRAYAGLTYHVAVSNPGGTPGPFDLNWEPGSVAVWGPASFRDAIEGQPFVIQVSRLRGDGLASQPADPRFAAKAVIGVRAVSKTQYVQPLAIAGVDFDSSLHVVSFLPGELYKTTAISIPSDHMHTVTKGFTIEITCLQGNALVSPPVPVVDIQRINVDPYVPGAGSYQGVFNGGEAVVSASASLVRLGNHQLATRVTGVATYLSQSARFNVTLDSRGQASVRLPPPLNTTTLTIYSTDGGASLLFKLRHFGGPSLDFMGDQLAYNARSNPAPVYGTYTAAMTSASDAPYYNLSTRPTYSIATAKVSTGGVLTLAMILGDGTAVTASGGLRLGLHDDNARPHAVINVPLYGGKGWLRGDVGFNSTLGDGNDFASAMDWRRPRMAGALYYPEGFVIRTTLAGQRYTAPAPGVRAMPGLDSTGAFNLALSEHFDVTPSIVAGCWWLVNNQIIEACIIG